MSRRSNAGIHDAWKAWGLYWPAAAMTVIGLILTGVVAEQMDRWAIDRDAERFAAEAGQVVKMIEQKMERYESALSRLRDACAQSKGMVSYEAWGGWLVRTLDMGRNYPCATSVMIAPKVSRNDLSTFIQRSIEEKQRHPTNMVTFRPEAPFWFPVWRQYKSALVGTTLLGRDLLSASNDLPTFEPALRTTFGWVAAQPARLATPAGEWRTGFWFAIPLRPLEDFIRIRGAYPSETPEETSNRRSRQRLEEITGLLVTFLDGERFFNEFNPTNSNTRVQLFTSLSPGPGSLVNPTHPPFPTAQQAVDIPMPWYGRKWIARVTSTPLFDAGSLRYRTWLVRGVGSVLTLAAAVLVAWFIRGRSREAKLAAQLRDALQRQERLSRDLHDGTLQSVYGIGLALQRAQRLADQQPAGLTRQIKETTAALQSVIVELRDFIRQTDPGGREEVPIGEALAGVVEHLRLATEMELDLVTSPGAGARLTPSQSLHLLNIAREALSNSIRHSGGRRVQITLDQQERLVRLEVRDDGRGFDPTAKHHDGRGLNNLASRVRELGGTHHWGTPGTTGCTLVVEIPVHNPPATTK